MRAILLCFLVSCTTVVIPHLGQTGGADQLQYESMVRCMYSDDVMGFRDTVVHALAVKDLGGKVMVLTKDGDWIQCREWKNLGVIPRNQNGASDE